MESASINIIMCEAFYPLINTQTAQKMVVLDYFLQSPTARSNCKACDRLRQHRPRQVGIAIAILSI